MIDWIIEKDNSLEGKDIEVYNPILVECVETLKPNDFRIFEFEGDEYLTLETINDVIVVTRNDIEYLKDKFIKIPESCQKKEVEEQQDS